MTRLRMFAAAAFLFAVSAFLAVGCNGSGSDESAKPNKPAVQQEQPHCEGGVCTVPSADEDRGGRGDHECECGGECKGDHKGECDHHDGKCEHDGKCDHEGEHDGECDGECDHDDGHKSPHRR